MIQRHSRSGCGVRARIGTQKDSKKYNMHHHGAIIGRKPLRAVLCATPFAHTHLCTKGKLIEACVGSKYYIHFRTRDRTAPTPFRVSQNQWLEHTKRSPFCLPPFISSSHKNHKSTQLPTPARPTLPGRSTTPHARVTKWKGAVLHKGHVAFRYNQHAGCCTSPPDGVS